MNLTPLFSAGPVVAAHALMAVLAVAVGALQITLRKGTAMHRLFGWCWVVLMALVALSSFGIHEFRLFGPFSPIHLLSILVLYSLWKGVAHVQRGNIDGHQRAMISLDPYAMVLTGALTLLPGRVMHAVFFGACNSTCLSGKICLNYSKVTRQNLAFHPIKLPWHSRECLRNL